MSEWYKADSEDDIDVSDDGKDLEIFVLTNDSGNVYVEVPIVLIWRILAKHRYEPCQD